MEGCGRRLDVGHKTIVVEPFVADGRLKLSKKDFPEDNEQTKDYAGEPPRRGRPVLDFR